MPCITEIPELVKAHQEYSGQGVEFVGLVFNCPDDVESVRGSVAEMKMRYKVVWLDRETAESLPGGKNYIPQTFVVDGGGKIVTHFVGYSDPKLLRKALNKALNPGMGG